MSLSIFSLLKCSKRNREKELYINSKKLLFEYIDLKNIISRLQDIDKLKNIIFSEPQKIFFDLIPKPKIMNEEEHRKQNRNFEIKKNKIKIYDMAEKTFENSDDKYKRKTTFFIQNVLKSKFESIPEERLREKYESLKNIPSLFSERILFYLDSVILQKCEEFLKIKSIKLYI